MILNFHSSTFDTTLLGSLAGTNAPPLTKADFKKNYVLAFSTNSASSGSTLQPTDGTGLFQMSNGRSVLVGLLVAANGGTRESPSVFAKVASHLDFIIDVTNNSFFCRKG